MDATTIARVGYLNLIEDNDVLRGKDQDGGTCLVPDPCGGPSTPFTLWWLTRGAANKPPCHIYNCVLRVVRNAKIE